VWSTDSTAQPSQRLGRGFINFAAPASTPLLQLFSPAKLKKPFSFLKIASLMPHIEQADQRPPIATTHPALHPKTTERTHFRLQPKPITICTFKHKLYLQTQTRLRVLRPAAWVPKISRGNFAVEPKSVFIFSHLQFFVDPNEPNEPKPCPPRAAHFGRFSQPFALSLHPLDE
jgi:hypothetical protein